MSDLGVQVSQVTGKAYARQAMLNYHDNLKMFVDKQAAKEFNEHMHEQMHFDENAS